MNKESFDMLDNLFSSIDISELINFNEKQNKTGNLEIVNLGEYIKERQKVRKNIGSRLQENLTPEQYENAKKCERINWDTECHYFYEAIGMGFYWADMPEGLEYWGDRYNTLVEQGL